jgi:hypothetical protein
VVPLHYTVIHYEAKDLTTTELLLSEHIDSLSWLWCLDLQKKIVGDPHVIYKNFLLISIVAIRPKTQTLKRSTI